MRVSYNSYHKKIETQSRKKSPIPQYQLYLTDGLTKIENSKTGYNKMAVPKKKTSKGKRNQRHATWKSKAAVAAQKALSMGKSVLTGRAQGYVYSMDETEDAD